MRRSDTAAREVLALAVPALGALIAEPLFLLADSAIVGRLGTVPLAALGLAGAILGGAIYLFVFLAYGTTASVARRLGAGDLRAALTQGVDGMWLALALGLPAALATFAAAPWLVDLFGPTPDVAAQAVTYLRYSLPGLPAMLVLLAATGVLRGLQDTRTPLVVYAAGAAVNAILNVLLVHGLGPAPRLGIAGSGLGTALTQLGMAAAVTVVVVRGARRHHASLRPDRAGILASGRSGVPLLVRTLALRTALLIATWVVTDKGEVALAAHQVVTTLWTLLALSLDAIAIAAQSLTGRSLGASDVPGTRATTALMIRWGVWGGVVLGVVLLLVRTWLGPLFVDDPAVWRAMSAALVVAAIAQPVSGFVFVLDGVLIGAGDGRYLAVAGVIQVLIYAPIAVAVAVWAPSGTAGLVWAWVSWTAGYMLARAVFLGVRARGSAWMVTGAVR
ncbi:MAG: MATE family efflux transporter [Kineosporiaceae bacterium]|nr:MATE family efflux transporter [Kineosporiaceae bacterium]